MGADIVDVGLHGRACGIAVTARQGVNNCQVFVAYLVDALGQAAQAKHRRAPAQVGDRRRQHRIARGSGNGGMEIAVVLARRFTQAIGAQLGDAFTRGIEQFARHPARRQSRRFAFEQPPARRARAGIPPSNKGFTTSAPPRCRSSVPSPSSRRTASRTGVRDMPRRVAICRSVTISPAAIGSAQDHVQQRAVGHDGQLLAVAHIRFVLDQGIHCTIGIPVAFQRRQCYLAAFPGKRGLPWRARATTKSAFSRRRACWLRLPGRSLQDGPGAQAARDHHRFRLDRFGASEARAGRDDLQPRGLCEGYRSFARGPAHDPDPGADLVGRR